jgi:hypothetical protein
MKRNRYVLLILALAVTAPLFVLWIISSLKNSFEYEVRARYASMPISDKELSGWLRAQPGVSHCAVGRHGPELHIFFVMGQNLTRRDPPVPDLQKELADLGYYDTIYYQWVRVDWYYK